MANLEEIIQYSRKHCEFMVRDLLVRLNDRIDIIVGWDDDYGLVYGVVQQGYDKNVKQYYGLHHNVFQEIIKLYPVELVERVRDIDDIIIILNDLSQDKISELEYNLINMLDKYPVRKNLCDQLLNVNVYDRWGFEHMHTFRSTMAGYLRALPYSKEQHPISKYDFYKLLPEIFFSLDT